MIGNGNSFFSPNYQWPIKIIKPEIPDLQTYSVPYKFMASVSEQINHQHNCFLIPEIQVFTSLLTTQ